MNNLSGFSFKYRRALKGIAAFLLVAGLAFVNPGFSGRFDKIGGTIKKGASSVKKGVKKGAGKVRKGVKKGAGKVRKGIKKAGKGAVRCTKGPGKCVKRAGKTAGRTARRGGRWVWRGGKRVWVAGKRAGGATGRAARQGGRWVWRGGKRVWVAGKRAGRTTGRAVRRGGRWVWRGGKRVWVAGKAVGRKIGQELKMLTLVCKGVPECITSIRLYQSYMLQLRTGVKMYRLPEKYRRLLAPHYRSLRNLNGYRFGYASRQPRYNATTDCNKTYFNDKKYVRWLRQGRVPRKRFFWLLHEVAHYNQCKRIGGRSKYALMWFGHSAKGFVKKPHWNWKEIHDNMPMEGRANRKAAAICRKLKECTPR